MAAGKQGLRQVGSRKSRRSGDENVPVRRHLLSRSGRMEQSILPRCAPLLRTRIPPPALPRGSARSCRRRRTWARPFAGLIPASRSSQPPAIRSLEPGLGRGWKHTAYRQHSEPEGPGNLRRAASSATGSWAATSATSATRACSNFSAGASRTSSVPGLNAKPITPTRTPRNEAAEPAAQGIQGKQALPAVDAGDRPEQLGVDTGALRQKIQRCHVLGKAGASVAHASVDSGPGPRVQRQSLAHVVYRGPHPVAQRGNFVDEGNAAARKTLLAYLTISALVMSVTNTGASIPAYSLRTDSTERESPAAAPMTIRSGCCQSCIAQPSRRNSGLAAYPKPVPASSRRIISFPVRAERCFS